MVPLTTCVPSEEPKRLANPAAPCPHSRGRFRSWLTPALAAEPAMALLPATRFRYSFAWLGVTAPAATAVSMRSSRIFQAVRISRFPVYAEARSGPLTGTFAYNGRSVAEIANLDDIAEW